MKVLSITPTFFPQLGGLEQVILELALRVRDHGVQMDVAHVEAGLTKRTETVQGVTTYRVPLLGHRALGWAPGLGRIARGYDLLHVHDPQLLAITANVRWSSGHIPAVLSTHGGFWHTNSGYLFKRIYERTLLRGAARHYRRVLASSVGDFDYFKRYAERIWLCSNGVHVKQFNAVTDAGRGDLGRWIYWGRLSRNKRVDRVIDYAAAAQRMGFQIDLLICGQDFDGLLPGLQAQVDRLQLRDSVRFVPYLDDAALHGELARRSVYITASEHEGFGLSVVEAMAAGLIVLCRDMVPLNRFVEHGRSGYLLNFDDGDTDMKSLVDLLSLTASAARSMSAAAREASSVHDWSLAVPRFVQHYREVLQS
jgi:alpha-1,3-mannosyltransferase